MKIYTTKEAAIILNVLPRAIQKKCKANDIRKKNNKYLITDEILKEWNVQTSENKRPNVRHVTPSIFGLADGGVIAAQNEQVDLQVQSLELEIERLKEENKKLKLELTKEIPHQDKLKKAIQLITLEAMDQGMQHKVFSEEEYQDLIGTITEVDFQKEQVNYLRSRVEKQDEILTKLVNQASERNFIEAKDKGFDKK
jgi:hypothetical protein